MPPDAHSPLRTCRYTRRVTAPETFSVARGSIGELFWKITEAVVVCEPGRVVAWNPGAEAMLGMTALEASNPDADLHPAFGNATKEFWELVEAGTGVARLETTGGSERALEARAWPLDGDEASLILVVLRDLTAEWRHMAGLQRLNVLARELLGESSLDVLLVRIVDAAKELARADFSALLLLKEGSKDEVTNFVYNATGAVPRAPPACRGPPCRAHPERRWPASTTSVAMSPAWGFRWSILPSPPSWPYPSSSVSGWWASWPWPTRLTGWPSTTSTRP